MPASRPRVDLESRDPALSAAAACLERGARARAGASRLVLLACTGSIGILAPMLSGCQKQQQAPVAESAERPRRGGTFVMAQDAPGQLDPACVDDVYEATIVNQLFDGLLSYDAHLSTVPCIASSWMISQDGRVYTFHLKRGVRFHDGAELTAEDVVYSLTRVFDLPEDQSMLAREYLCRIEGSREYAERKTDHISGLVSTGPYGVQITLDCPSASFLAVLAAEMSRIVPKHYIERVGDAEFARHPIGSGPFRLAGWTPGDRVVLTAFDDYAARRAWLDSLVYELPSRDTADYAASHFLSGSLSAVSVPEGRLHEFVTRPRTKVITRQQLCLSFIGLNSHREPFDDVRVRQAFALAIDRDPLIRADSSLRIPPNGMLPPGMPGYTPESKLLEHDLTRARQLLEAAGYPGGRGLPTIVFTTASHNERTLQLIHGIGRQVGEVGFQVQVEYLSWLDFSRRLTARDLQCFSVSWVADIPDADSFLYPMCHSDGSANFDNYHSARVDSLLLVGRRTTSSLARLEVYREAERLILQDAPIVPLYHPQSAIAVQNVVRGLNVTPMGIGNFAMEDVWLATDSPGIGALAQAAPRQNLQAGTQALPSTRLQPQTSRAGSSTGQQGRKR